jgi:hypothetical protein
MKEGRRHCVNCSQTKPLNVGSFMCVCVCVCLFVCVFVCLFVMRVLVPDIFRRNML